MARAGGNGDFYLGFGDAGLFRCCQVACKPGFAAGAVFTDGLLVTFLVGREAVALAFAVVEVEDHAAKLHAPLAHAAVVEADRQFGIFASPAAERFVVTVDADQVVAPEGHVAAFDEAGGAQRPVEECHERDADDVVAVAYAPHQRRERGDLPAEHLAGEHFGDDAPRPGDVAAPLCEDHVILDEVALQDQVAVDLYDVFAAARRDGFVADHGKAEPLVLVPDVPDGDGRHRLEMADDIAGADTRAVVGDQDFRGHGRLLHYAVQAQVEGPRPVVGGDDQ